MSIISNLSEHLLKLEHGFELTHSRILMLTNNPASIGSYDMQYLPNFISQSREDNKFKLTKYEYIVKPPRYSHSH